MTDAREAGPEDMTPLAGALARAFHDDPVMVWLFGERDEPRLRRLRRFMGSEARRHSRHGGTGAHRRRPPGGRAVGPARPVAHVVGRHRAGGAR